MSLMVLEERRDNEAQPLAEKTSTDRAANNSPDHGDDATTLQGSVSRKPSVRTDGHSELHKTNSKLG